MLTYKAAYFYEDDDWNVGQVLDFPGAHSQGRGLADARRMLGSALVEYLIETGKPLPIPSPGASDIEADLEEPLYLLMKGAARVEITAVEVSA